MEGGPEGQALVAAARADKCRYDRARRVGEAVRGGEVVGAPDLFVARGCALDAHSSVTSRLWRRNSDDSSAPSQASKRTPLVIGQ